MSKEAADARIEHMLNRLAEMATDELEPGLGFTAVGGEDEFDAQWRMHNGNPGYQSPGIPLDTEHVFDVLAGRRDMRSLLDSAANYKIREKLDRLKALSPQLDAPYGAGIQGRVVRRAYAEPEHTPFDFDTSTEAGEAHERLSASQVEALLRSKAKYNLSAVGHHNNTPTPPFWHPFAEQARDVASSLAAYLDSKLKSTR